MVSFGEQQLQRFGWEKGKGLGREENGRANPIKVAVKNDKNGVGKKAENFEFAWWEHVYNKASSNIIVDQQPQPSEKPQKAKKAKKTEEKSKGKVKEASQSSEEDQSEESEEEEEEEEEEEKKVVLCSVKHQLKRDELITVERPSDSQRPAISNPQSLLFGLFVPASSGKEEDDHESFHKKDFSTKASNDEVFKACEGRRLGHRGGFKQVGKEERLQMQETGQNHHNKRSSSSSPSAETEEEDAPPAKRRRVESEEEGEEKSKKVKKSKTEKAEKVEKDKSKKSKDKKEKKAKKDKKDKKDKKEKKEKKEKKAKGSEQ